MAERYAYIPVIGLFIVAAWGVPDLMQGLCSRSLLALLAGIIILAAAVQTRQQLGYWRDNISLYRHTLQITAGNYVVHTNLGLALQNRGALDGAVNEYREALRINPFHAGARNNLETVFVITGDYDAALHQFQEAIRIDPDNAMAQTNLKLALDQKKMQDETIKLSQ